MACMTITIAWIYRYCDDKILSIRYRGITMPKTTLEVSRHDVVHCLKFANQLITVSVLTSVPYFQFLSRTSVSRMKSQSQVNDRGNNDEDD